MLVYLREVRTREPKVADLQVTIGVDKNITRLEVAVKDIRRVYVAQACEELVQQPLDMHFIILGLRTDQVGQVGIQKLKDYVDRVESGPVRREQHITHGNDIRVLQKPKKPQFTNYADCVCLIGQDAVDMLDRDFLLGIAVLRSAAGERKRFR